MSSSVGVEDLVRVGVGQDSKPEVQDYALWQVLNKLVESKLNCYFFLSKKSCQQLYF